MEMEEDIVKALQEAHRQDNQEEILRLENEMHLRIKMRLENLQSDVEMKSTELNERASESLRKIHGERRRIYKQLIGLYRQSVKLSKLISDVKKGMRMEREKEQEEEV